MPQRIVGVWFISVGAFGDTLADASYSDLRIRSPARVVEIFD